MKEKRSGTEGDEAKFKKVVQHFLKTPPKPHIGKDEPKGMRALPGTPETERDPQNPNR